MAPAETHQAIEAVFRIERARLIGGLVRMLRDIDLAEEFAQDALVAALADWPRAGVPANPGAWLMATAKRRAIDHIRRERMLERKHGEIARDAAEAEEESVNLRDAALDDALRILGEQKPGWWTMRGTLR